MAILGGFRADQLISELISETDANSRNALRLTERLKKIGPKVIPKVIDALAMSDKKHQMLFVDILASQVSEKTLKHYKEGLADGGDRVVSGTAWALSSSNSYDANSLLEFFDDPEVSKPALIEILKVHKDSLSMHELLRRAYEMEPKEKAALFAIIEDIATEDMIPDLIARMGGKDPVIKVHLMRLLSKFNHAEINHALEMQLSDTGPQRAEQGRRRTGQDQSPGDDQITDPRAQGRVGIHAPRRGRGTERNRRRGIGQGSAQRDQGRRLVGPCPCG